MKNLIEINPSLLASITGGKCTGVFLGTSDGKYGICIGISRD